MTKHRFFISKHQIRNDSVFLLDKQARQIHNVLRLRPGDKISVLNNEGWEFEVELLTSKPDLVTGHLLNKWQVKSEPKIELTLFQSMLKQDKFEWVLQKGTELGVASFVPMISERSIVRKSSLKANKIARWRRIISEAAEQSGRGRIPTLEPAVEYETALKEARANHLALISWENELDNNITSALACDGRQESEHISSLAILIGPEGGFSESEIQDALAANVIPVTLGPRILRAETAAIVAAALTLHELGETG